MVQGVADVLADINGAVNATGNKLRSDDVVTESSFGRTAFGHSI